MEEENKERFIVGNYYLIKPDPIVFGSNFDYSNLIKYFRKAGELEVYGPIYSIIKIDSEDVTVLTRMLEPIPEEDQIIISYCKNNCPNREDCITNCALSEYKHYKADIMSEYYDENKKEES